MPSITRSMVKVVLMFTLPIVIIFYWVDKGIRYYLDFAQAELYGNEYQRPLEDLHESLSNYRQFVHSMKAAGSAADDKDATGKVDRALAAVIAVNTKLTVQLKTSHAELLLRNRGSANVKNMQRKWKDLVGKVPSGSADALDAQVLELIASTKMLVVHIGDTSFLILDPDLDTYYSMDATLLGLPQNQDRIQQIMADIGWAAQSGALTDEVKINARVQAALLSDDIARMTGDRDTVLNEDANFYDRYEGIQQKLPPAVEKWQAAVTSLQEMLAAPDTIKSDPFKKAGQAALDESFAVWRTWTDEFDAMLRIRHAIYERKLWTTIGMVLGTLFLAVVVTLMFGKSIAREVRAGGPAPKLGARLTVAAILFLVPAAIEIYNIRGGYTERTDFAKWEMYGNEYQKPLADLQEGLSNFRLYAHAMKTTGASNDPKDSQSKIERALKDVAAVDTKLTVPLQTSSERLAVRKRQHLRVENLQREWKEISSQLAGLSAKDADDKIVHLIGDTRGLIVHIGDTSFLILDPDLDSYYSMDSTLLALPWNQDRLQQITADIGWAAQQGELTVDKKNHARVQAALLQGDIDRIGFNLITVKAEDKNFFGYSDTLYKRLPPAVDRWKKEMTALQDMLSNPQSIKGDAPTKAGRSAMDESFALWRTWVIELDILLQKRSDVYEKDMWTAISWTAGFMFLSILITFFIGKSLSKAIRTSAASPSPLAAAVRK